MERLAKLYKRGEQSVARTGRIWLSAITDASNAIWNAFDAPTSDAQWAGLEKAALALIDATKLNAVIQSRPRESELT